MGTHVFNGFCHIHPSLQGVHWADGPWARIREIKAVMPNTPQQMLLRGQNLLGYRHYSDDVVRQFIERCAENGYIKNGRPCLQWLLPYPPKFAGCALG
jgi:hypothetical protein